MITSEGAAHRAQRLAAQPAFHRQRIGEYGGIIVRKRRASAIPGVPGSGAISPST